MFSVVATGEVALDHRGHLRPLGLRHLGVAVARAVDDRLAVGQREAVQQLRPSRCLRRVGEPVALGQRVDQRRLAHVRATDHRDLGGRVGEAIEVVGRRDEAQLERRRHRSTLARPQNSLRAPRRRAGRCADAHRRATPRVPRGRLRRARWRGRRRRRRAHARADLAPARAPRRRAGRPVHLAAAPGVRAAADPHGRPRSRTTRRCSRAPSMISSAPACGARPAELGPGAGDVPDRRGHGTCRTGPGTSTTATTAARGSIWGVNVFLFVDDRRARGGGTRRRARARRSTSGGSSSARSAGHPHAEAVADGVRRQPSLVPGAERSRRHRRPGRAVPRGDRRRRRCPPRSSSSPASAGDVVVCHPWLIHNVAPNVRDRPRMMRASRAFHVDAAGRLGESSRSRPSSAALPAIELAALALGRTSGAAVSLRHPRLTWRRGRRVVDVASPPPAPRPPASR